MPNNISGIKPRKKYLNISISTELLSISHLNQCPQLSPMGSSLSSSTVQLSQIESFLRRAASVLIKKLIQPFSLSGISTHCQDEITMARLYRQRTSSFLEKNQSLSQFSLLGSWCGFQNIPKFETDKDQNTCQEYKPYWYTQKQIRIKCNLHLFLFHWR